MKIDPKKIPVMKNCCKTCPFKKDEKGLYQDIPLANEVIKRTLFKAHQICHGTETQNREPTHRFVAKALLTTTWKFTKDWDGIL